MTTIDGTAKRVKTRDKSYHRHRALLSQIAALGWFILFLDDPFTWVNWVAMAGAVVALGRAAYHEGKAHEYEEG